MCQLLGMNCNIPTARLKDKDFTVDFSRYTSPRDRVAMIATQPLTVDDTWSTLAPGTLILFSEGEAVRSAATIRGVAKVETA